MRGAIMKGMLQSQRGFGTSRLHIWSVVGMSLLAALVLWSPVSAQQAQPINVSGKVTTPDGGPLPGVTVRIRGTNTTTVTDAEGKYAIDAPSDAVLVFGLIGYRGTGQGVSGRANLDVTMERVITVLPEVVVTGYTSQRRADITGAVSTVDVDAMARKTGTSALQRLDGAVAGVTVENSGSPGARSTVRIRGISSFQNNDPLIIVDGTAVQDSYLNFLNPNEIGSVQVLKDASAASIYGARAGNGVIIIETNRGRAGRRQVSLDVRTGIASPTRGYDDFLITDALQYFEVVKQSYQNAGLAVPTNVYGDVNNPTVPAFIWPNDGVNQTTDTLSTSGYSYPSNLIMPGSAGTNWWKAVFSPAQIRDVNLAVSGGGEDNAYNVAFHYLNQEGTAAFNLFQRGTVRVNTAFSVDKVSIGENIALSREQHSGGLPDDPTGYAEDGILGKNILMQPVIPVRDIAGNFASGKAVGLGNQSNPLAFAFGHKDDISTNDRIFGNVFAGFEANAHISFKTRFGFNLGQGSFKGYNPITPENSEPTLTNGINENYNQNTDWSWSNTLNYLTTSGKHHLAVLLGQEANQSRTRFVAAGIANLINSGEDSRYIQDALGDAATKNVTSTGSIGSLLGFFGKADYNYNDRYFLSVTVRRDGSSRLGPSNRWGTFPAVGLGWRVSQESFLANSSFLSSLMLRVGYGITGNENIPQGRIVSQFGGDRGETFYDIGGGNTITPGYRQTALGNANLKWEENKSVNVGVDATFLDGRATLITDIYSRTTSNLLFDPPLPGTAGIASPPIINIGKMKNTGIDVSLGYRGTIGAGTLWSATLNGSHYKNEIVSIDGVTQFFFGPISTRYGNQVINQVGSPIGSFYGLVADGFFLDANDVASHATQDGAAPGRIKFRDVNGDGIISLADRTVIGSPHPDFTAGLDLSVRRGAWDFSATFFGTFGNEIFDVQKEFYVFRNFSTNVRTDLLDNSWTPQNPNAKYPRLDVNDNFSHAISSFYIEDGSYVRLRTLQIGYTLPPAFIRWIPASRVYVEAENLFTITGYPGLDPALPAANVFGPAGDIRDQYRGVDRGTYPSNRTIMIGISTSF
jgi:TonB-linked SusC/RagA family outer membrane protein